jgi:hypothetical protein
VNRELFQKIHDVISVSPGRLDMTSWEDSEGYCGTTRCIAGWAIHLTTGKPLFAEGLDGYPALHESVARLAGDAGINPAAHSMSQVIQEVAANLLALPADTEVYPVFHTTNERALEWLDAHSSPEV